MALRKEEILCFKNVQKSKKCKVKKHKSGYSSQ